MYPYYNYYKVGRFIFALALLVAFQATGLLHVVPGLLSIIAIYSIIALVSLLITQEVLGYFDFILDIVFISALLHVSFGIYSYLSLFYLFPIFFSSIIIRARKKFLYPAFAISSYGAIFVMHRAFLLPENMLNMLLHAFSFLLISVAGNSLNERLEKQAKYIKSLEDEQIKMQGYERLYRVSADLAHELRNPLASISAAVQFLKEGKATRDFIDMLDTETKRLIHLVNDFLMFSRPSDASREEFDLSDMLKIIVGRYGTDKPITADIEDGLSIEANRMFIEVALTNIVKNAWEAGKLNISVSLRKQDADKSSGVEEEVVIEVQDDGHGIEEADKERVFEPFFTTKPNGTGLGLAIAYRVITSFGGHIFAGRSSYGGAKITIVLPYKHEKTAKEGK